MNLKTYSCAIALALTAQVACADMYEPSPPCFKPIKPYKFNSQWEVDSFNNDVARYKQCIKLFVEEQQQAAAIHKNAAAQAIEQWNNFVKYELNQ